MSTFNLTYWDYPYTPPIVWIMFHGTSLKLTKIVQNLNLGSNFAQFSQLCQGIWIHDSNKLADLLLPLIEKYLLRIIYLWIDIFRYENLFTNLTVQRSKNRNDTCPIGCWQLLLTARGRDWHFAPFSRSVKRG